MRAPIKQNAFDRLVGVFAPSLALRMMRDRSMMSALESGYHGGKRGRRQTKNWLPGGGSADADLLPELDDIRARTRDLTRNLPIATGALITKKTHVVGDGLVLNAEIDRETLGLSEVEAGTINRLIESEFAIFCRSADFTLVQHFAELQGLVYGGVKESGDIFAIRRYRSDAGKVYGTRVQVIEADLVSNPGRRADTDTLVAGIEHTRQGVPIAIHVSDRHPGELRGRALNWRRVPMRYNDGRDIVLHVFQRLRPGQTRGIPDLAPVIEWLKQFLDYTEAEIRAAVVSAMFTVFVKTDSGDSDKGPLPTMESSGTDSREEMTLNSGAIIDLAQGESIEVADPKRPNPQFDAFVTAFLRQLGVALDLPFEMLIKHFTASYSASRAALELAYHSFRRERNWFVRRFVEPVYGWFFEEAVLTGRIEAPGFFDDPAIRQAWLGASWTGPVRISLDPKKDAEADEIDLRNKVKSRQQIMTERTGGDFERKIEQINRENEAAGEPYSAATTGPAAQTDNPDFEESDEEGDAANA